MKINLQSIVLIVLLVVAIAVLGDCCYRHLSLGHYSSTPVSENSVQEPSMDIETREDLLPPHFYNQNVGSSVNLVDSLCTIMYQGKKCAAICDTSGTPEIVEPLGRAAKGRVFGKYFYFFEDSLEYSNENGVKKRLPASIMVSDFTNTDLWVVKSQEPPYSKDLKEMLGVWTNLSKYPDRLELEYQKVLSSGIPIPEQPASPEDNKEVLDNYKNKHFPRN